VPCDESDSITDVPRHGRRWWQLGLSAAWLILLIGEALALSLSFDTNIPVIADHNSVMARLIVHSSALLRLAICGAAATTMVLLGSAELRQELSNLADQSRDRGLARSWIAIHLAAYATFFWLTKRLIEGMAQSTHQTLPVVLWMSCGAGTGISWALAAKPLGFWLHVLRRGWKALLFGTAVGILALEIGSTTDRLWASFQNWTFQAAGTILSLFDRAVICNPITHELGISGFSVSIAPVCSGFEGIGLIWAFLGGYLVLFRRELRFPQALLLIPIGTVIIWLFNVLRIVGLVLVGAWGRPEVALGGFHSQAGWLAFNIVALGLVALARRVGMFSRVDRPAEVQPIAIANPTAAYLGPLLAITATSMVTGAMSAGQFDRFYPARVLAALAALWIFRQGYASLNWSWSWFAPAIGALVFFIWIALEPIPSRNDAASGIAIQQALAGMPVFASAAWLAARIFGSVVTVPLAEELAFRGYLVRRLIAADFEDVPTTRFTWPSFLISSILFGAMHHERWLTGTIAGMLYALVLRRNGQLSHAMLSHATTNALIAAHILITGTWSLWM